MLRRKALAMTGDDHLSVIDSTEFSLRVCAQAAGADILRV